LLINLSLWWAQSVIKWAMTQLEFRKTLNTMQLELSLRTWLQELWDILDSYQTCVLNNPKLN
jgi:hypothetical protein